MNAGNGDRFGWILASTRFPVLLSAAVFVAGALLYFLISREMLAKYEAIEGEEVARQMERSVEAVERRLDRLQSTAGDWAAWDDTYAFMQDRSPDFLAENTRPQALANLGVNYLMFIDGGGSILHAKAIDRGTGSERPFPESLCRRAAEGAPFARITRAQDRFRGLCLVDGGWALLAGMPVLRSDGSGPPRGIVVFGLQVDEPVCQLFAQTVRFDLSFLSDADAALPAAAREAIARGSPGTHAVVPLDDERVAGYTVLQDMDGRPSLVLRGILPRTIHARGHESRRYLLLTFLGAGAVVGLIASLLTVRLAAVERKRERVEETLWVRNWALDSAISGVALADLGGTITYANASLASMWGRREPREMLGLPAVSVWSRPEEAEQAVAAIKDSGRWEGELEAKRLDGTTFLVHLSAALIRDREGAPVGMMASFIDVTARRQVEAELFQAKQRLEFLVANTPAVTYSCRAEGDYGATWVSRNIESLLGYRPEELTSSSDFWAAHIHPEDAPRVFAELPRLFANGRHGHDYRFRHRDGSWRWMHDELRLIRNGDGRPVEILGTWLDVTERRRAEEERRELERRLLHAQKLESLGVLAGGIAHDFNNLLMAILGNFELALLELPPGGAARSHLERSVQALERARALTQQMLAYSGRGSFLVTDIDLAALVRENAEFLRATIPKNLIFDSRVPEGLPLVSGDAGQLQQVVMNLITNASEAIGDGPGTVTLAAGARHFGAGELSGSCAEAVPEPGQFVWLEVTDDGCGMDAETRQRLFDPFFSTKFTGRGLGMSSVLGIVRGHRGAIFIRSEVGRGTTVRVLFPAVARPTVGSAGPAVETPAADAAGPGSVLVVDDESSVLEVCRDMLTTLGWRVLTAADGLEGVETFRRNAGGIDFVILDLSMPVMDGIATLELMRHIAPGVRAILMSGYSEQEATTRFASGDLAGFLQKPFGFAKLRAAVAAFAPRGGGAAA